MAKHYLSSFQVLIDFIYWIMWLMRQGKENRCYLHFDLALFILSQEANLYKYHFSFLVTECIYVNNLLECDL